MRDQNTGDDRFYIPDLMRMLGNIRDFLDTPALSGGFQAALNVFFTLPGSPQQTGGIAIEIPDITDPSNILVNLTELDALDSFGKVSFFDIIQGLSAVADILVQFETFAFLDEELPFVETSIADMLSWASKLADLFEAVGNGDSEDLDAMVDEFETQLETLFNLANQEDVELVADGANVVGEFNPNGSNNGIEFSAPVAFSNATISIIDTQNASGGAAIAHWTDNNERLTIEIDSGVTTAQSVVDAVNGLQGSPWLVSLTEGGGSGPVSTPDKVLDISVDSTPEPELMPDGNGNVVGEFNPRGPNNGVAFLAPVALANATIKVFGSHDASGGGAVAAWDVGEEVLTIQIDSGVTTAQSIVNAVNGLQDSTWNSSLT